jgi:hypothetical protein
MDYRYRFYGSVIPATLTQLSPERLKEVSLQPFGRQQGIFLPYTTSFTPDRLSAAIKL